MERCEGNCSAIILGLEDECPFPSDLSRQNLCPIRTVVEQLLLANLGL